MNKSSNFDIKVAEQIIDEAIMDNKPHYLIKWKYLPHQFDTWESLENLQSVADILQKWIRNRRQNKQAILFSNASSYCDTVNYINPSKRVSRKKKIISKKKPSKSSPNQIVILDEDNDQENNNFLKLQESDSFINDNEESQIIEQSLETTGKPEKKSLWGTKDISDTCDQEQIKLQNENKQTVEPLKFDPEKEDKETPLESESQQKLKPGMKVVGTIRSEDIQKIVQRFKFRDDWCCKLELKDGRLRNMREQDLKKLCPQLLMEFYEDNGIKI